jgi:hypothetical protein
MRGDLITGLYDWGASIAGDNPCPVPQLETFGLKKFVSDLASKEKTWQHLQKS